MTTTDDSGWRMGGIEGVGGVGKKVMGLVIKLRREWGGACLIIDDSRPTNANTISNLTASLSLLVVI